MGKLYGIDGYWLNDKVEFKNALVYEYAECPYWLNDNEVFWFGLNEADIKSLIQLGEDTWEEFVITECRTIKDEQDDLEILSEIFKIISETPNDIHMASKVRKFVNKKLK